LSWNRVRDGIARARTARRGTELRTLLRSRPVQVALGATLVVQTVALAGGGGDAPKAVVVPAVLPPVAALAAPPKAPPAAVSARAEAHAKGSVLARKYRARGYRVPDSLAKQIVDAATAHGIELEVAFGLVATESGFRRTARSHVGATGLAQLMPATARWLEPGTTRRELEDPETNLRLGFRYLRDMIEKYDGSTHLALLAYNRGPGTVDRVLRRGGNPDNGYPRKVMRVR
jgi:soluble lytic murein transglycosylase-like protein